MKRYEVIRNYTIILLVLLSFHAASFAGNIWHVKQGSTGSGSSWADANGTLAYALVLAQPGDQIWVATGTYKPVWNYDMSSGDPNRTKHFRMKNGVSIYGSFSGKESNTFDVSDRDLIANETILSGDLLGNDTPNLDPCDLLNNPNRSDNCYHLFYHPNDLYLDSTAVLDGFTITAAHANGVSPEEYFGGGMYNNQSSPTVTNCTFSGNSSLAGGGMTNINSSPIVSNCTFNSNAANGGGGILNDESGLTVTNCIFTDNLAFNSKGGGIYIEQSSVTVTNCIFSGNVADDGGGIHNASSNIIVTNCTFSGNTAYYTGGGIANDESDIKLTNCTFTGNSADDGGGLYLWYFMGGYNTAITNCIFWGNFAPDGNEVHNNSNLVEFSYCDIAGSGGSTNWDPNIGVDGGGNIDADPLFFDADGPDGIAGTIDDNLRLLCGSPCIDFGNNDAVPAAITTDLDGGERFVDDVLTVDDGNIVDIGAYEYKVIYVDADAEDGSQTGQSWDDAFVDMNDALNNAVRGDSIWVAQGTYKPSYDYGIGDGNDRYNHFRMINNVGIYGGFPNDVNDANFADRNVETYETILSGDLLGNDTPGLDPCDLFIDSNRAENCFHIFYHPEELILGSTAILDGFTITGGNADDDWPHNVGGGVCNFYYSSPIISHCTFTGNSAKYGGGMRNVGSDSTVANCVFTGNLAEYGGGLDNGNNSDSTVINCIFSANTADSGGGIKNTSSSPTIINCTFTGNSAQNWGGGMHSFFSSSPTVTNCTFTGNLAGSSGGGMYNQNNSKPVVTNCIFQGNIAIDGNEIYNFTSGMSSTPTFSHCDIAGCGSSGTGWDNSLGIDGGGNIDADPCFVDTDSNDFSLKPYSPCIDEGNDLAIPADITTDIIEKSRVADGDGDNIATVDMGAYELQSEVVYVDTNAPGDIQNGQSWNTAYKFLEDGILLAHTKIFDGGELVFIRIADGNYYPDRNVSQPEGSQNEEDTFPMDDRVVWLGGYGGNSEVDPNYRDIETYRTVLTGAIHATQSLWSNHVITALSVNSTAGIDGCIIRDGFADASPPYNRGAGIYLEGSNPHITNCKFVNHWADYGAAMVNRFASTPVIQNCIFENCSWANYGGGIANFDSSPIITDCNFTGNTVGRAGGIINDNSSPQIEGCSFINNNVSNQGGGIYNQNASSPQISDCYFSNQANAGGGIYNEQCTLTVRDCNFSASIVNYDGGGIYNNQAVVTVSNCYFSNNISNGGNGGAVKNQYSNCDINDCVFVNNSAISGGAIDSYLSTSLAANRCAFNGNSTTDSGGAVNIYQTTSTLDNCLFSGNNAGNHGGAVKIESSDVNTINCTFYGNTSGLASDAILLYSGSLNITNSIFWAHPLSAITGITTISYSCMQDGDPGQGNIYEDPCFIDPNGPDDELGTSDDNLHLKSFSPCVNTGNPEEDYSNQTDLGGQQRVRYSRIDMGAYEVFPVAGDFDEDEGVDFLDFADFSDNWLDDNCSLSSWCDNNDIDKNGFVNFEDLAYFISQWLMGIE